MVRAFLILLSLTMSAASATAQTCGTEDLIAALDTEERARLDALVAGHPYPEGTLFRATKAGSEVVVVGTIHIPDPRLAGMVDAVRPALAEAEVLVLESTAEDEAGLQALATQKPELFFINEGPTLIEMLTEEEWAKVADRLGDIGIPAFLASKFQPWYLSMTLAIPPCAMTLMQSGEKGLDRTLELIAKEQGTPVSALDDTEAVLRIFADEPIETQLDGLRVSLETQADGDAATSTLIEGYFDGRIRETWEFGRILIERSGIEGGAEMFEEVNQALLLDRNRSWEDRLPALIDGKDAVIAVGAAHLSGETGVLRALERMGYAIAPL